LTSSLTRLLAACAYGLISFFIIPTSPETTRWLNEEERALAVKRLDIEHMGQTHEKTTARAVFKAIANPFTWACTLAYGFINVRARQTCSPVCTSF